MNAVTEQRYRPAAAESHHDARRSDTNGAIVPQSWQVRLIDRLASGADYSGGWGYRYKTTICAEPTALACLALAAHGAASRQCSGALATLAKSQLPDGSVPISSQVQSPCWTTALCISAWTIAGPITGRSCQPITERAVKWLLSTCGRRLAPRPDVFGHDQTLQGWPWVDGTHSWLEPTAYAVLALRTVHKTDHPRTREGLRVIRDRVLPRGGWNYGNTRVLASTLQPFPATTGIALTALARETEHTGTRKSIDYLIQELARVRAPFSLAWGLIGLTAQAARPVHASSWLAQCVDHYDQHHPTPIEDALLLLADAVPCPLTRVPDGDTHG